MDRPLSELFVAFADYCMRRGIGGEGIHEIDGPDGLKVTMNSTREPHGALPAFHAAIMARGWPIAVINPYGGDLLCLTEWDEAKLIDAFKGDGPTPGVDLKAVPVRTRHTYRREVMGEVTGIGWTDHTWSPWWGCTKVSVGDHGACVKCYAEALDKRVGGDHWGVGKPRRAMSENHWAQPPKWDRAAAAAGEQRFVFPSMCDPFDNEVDPAWRKRFFGLIRATPHLTWLLLTKRPQNIVKQAVEAGDMPSNAALGATVVTQKEADRDVPHLIKADAALAPAFVFLSVEPMQEHIDLTPWLTLRMDWVICGGESGPSPRPMHVDWARQLRNQCAVAGVPFFFKQWGGRTPKANGKELDGREWCERPRLAA